MTIKDDIFNSPVNIGNMVAEKKKAQDCVDSLFVNFMYYAKKNWSYIASAQAGGEALLNGTARQVPCGGIATALKILIEEKLKLQVQYITKSGYVWTKSSFLSFDQKVRGNVSRAESPTLFNEGCFFNEHYFIKCGSKYYDPCLNSIYATENEAVRRHYAPTEILVKGSVMPGADNESVLVFQPNVIVTGWQRGAWLIVKEKDVLRHVTDKNSLMTISIRLKTGKLAMKAREESRKLFVAADRLSFWKEEHNRAGIKV